MEKGAHFGPYEILAPLGAGGMGEVYRAADQQLQREVALKILLAEATADPSSPTAFLPVSVKFTPKEPTSVIRILLAFIEIFL
jgi:serine/threonine protein kinase